MDVQALRLHQPAHQRAGDALGSRPRQKRGRIGNARPVVLGDDPALIGHYNGQGVEALFRVFGRFLEFPAEALVQFVDIHIVRNAVQFHPVADGPEGVFQHRAFDGQPLGLRHQGLAIHVHQQGAAATFPVYGGAGQQPAEQFDGYGLIFIIHFMPHQTEQRVDRPDKALHPFVGVLPGIESVGTEVFGGIAGGDRRRFVSKVEGGGQQQNQDGRNVFQRFFHCYYSKKGPSLTRRHSR